LFYAKDIVLAQVYRDTFFPRPKGQAPTHRVVAAEARVAASLVTSCHVTQGARFEDAFLFSLTLSVTFLSDVGLLS